MDVRAAVAVAAGKPLEVTTVQLEGPREGEVLVEVKATYDRATGEENESGLGKIRRPRGAGDFRAVVERRLHRPEICHQQCRCMDLSGHPPGDRGFDHGRHLRY